MIISQNDEIFYICDDMKRRLESLGIKKNYRFETALDAFDSVVLLAEFYQSAYKEALYEVFKNHSRRDAKTGPDSNSSCCCEFCKQFRTLNL
jgi:hypothetical protein